jgi:hypothetical protein
MRVEADFAAIKLKYELKCEEIPFPQHPRLVLPYASYQLLGSNCDINNAIFGDRCHTSMSGGGLDRECLLYFSKIAEWAHEHIPQIWPNKLLTDLRNPNSHSDTLCEVWWLSHLIGARYDTVRHSVPTNLTRPKGNNFDWQVNLSCGVTLSLEVKRRPGDIARFLDNMRLKPKSMFDSIDKFGPANPPDALNVGCISLFGPITPAVHIAARNWLADTPSVSALALYAPFGQKTKPLVILTQAGLGYIQHFFSEPDNEDNTYFAPVSFAQTLNDLSTLSQPF